MIDLRKHVGDPYRKYDEQGRALGCLAPVYLLHPDLPHYDWPEQDVIETVMALLDKHCKRVNPFIEPVAGDIVAFRMPMGLIHIGVYLGANQIIHVAEGGTMETMRLWTRRIEGRWQHGTRIFWSGGKCSN